MLDIVKLQLMRIVLLLLAELMHVAKLSMIVIIVMHGMEILYGLISPREKHLRNMQIV